MWLYYSIAIQNDKQSRSITLEKKINFLWITTQKNWVDRTEHQHANQGKKLHKYTIPMQWVLQDYKPIYRRQERTIMA